MSHEIDSMVQIPHRPEDPDHEIPFPGTAKVSNASDIPGGMLKLRFFTLFVNYCSQTSNNTWIESKGNHYRDGQLLWISLLNYHKHFGNLVALSSSKNSCSSEKLSQTIYSLKWRMIIAVIYATFAAAKRKPEKNSGLYGIRTLDLCDTGAALYRRSQEFESRRSLSVFQAFFLQL